MKENDQYLRILAVGHYVLAGVVALFSLLWLIYIYFGQAMLKGELEGEPAPPVVGIFMTAFGVVMLIFGVGFAVTLVIAGRMLEARRRFVFCLVVAGIACTLAPFGTTLGVFTILVLMRPEVKAVFDANDSRATAGPG
jgi:hypothetical protein